MKKTSIIALLAALMLMVASVGFAAAETEVVLRRGYGAPHGELAVGRAVVLTAGDTIVAAHLDEFQYMAPSDELTPVPNSDKGFGGNYAKPEAPLASKKVNDESYSKNMADKAKATMLLSEGYAAIEAYAQGKTGQEIKDYAATQEAGKPVDAITSSTLVDTVGYLNLLADAALAQ